MAHRAALRPGNDQVIEHGKVDRFAGEREAAREMAIRSIRIGIAAGMVVGDDQPGTAVVSGVGDNLTEG